MNFGIAMIWGVALGSVFGTMFENIPLGMIAGAAVGAFYALFFHSLVFGQKDRDGRD